MLLYCTRSSSISTNVLILIWMSRTATQDSPCVHLTIVSGTMIFYNSTLCVCSSIVSVDTTQFSAHHLQLLVNRRTAQTCAFVLPTLCELISESEIHCISRDMKMTINKK